MKLALGSALILFLFGSPSYAQEQDKDKEKPPQQEEHKKQEPEKNKPEEKKQPAPKQQQDDKKQPDKKEQEKKQQDHASPQQKQQQGQQQPSREAQPAPGNSGNRGGRRIPDERFRASFGSQHHFRVERRSDRRFQFGGFWFAYTDWPGGWDYNDDFYVDDLEGAYYLYDLRHPGVRILVIVE